MGGSKDVDSGLGESLPAAACPSGVASASCEKPQPASDSASPWTMPTVASPTRAARCIGKVARRSSSAPLCLAVTFNRSMMRFERSTVSSPTQSGVTAPAARVYVRRG